MLRILAGRVLVASADGYSEYFSITVNCIQISVVRQSAAWSVGTLDSRCCGEGRVYNNPTSGRQCTAGAAAPLPAVTKVIQPLRYISF